MRKLFGKPSFPDLQLLVTTFLPNGIESLIIEKSGVSCVQKKNKKIYFLVDVIISLKNGKTQQRHNFLYIKRISKSLHLCLLVNRTWCETTAPILWKNPITLKQFSFHTTREICYYPNAKHFFSNLNIPLIRKLRTIYLFELTKICQIILLVFYP